MNMSNWGLGGVQSISSSTSGNSPNGVMDEVMRNGNVPVAGRMGSGMVCGGGGVVPPILLDESRVPKFYLEAISACGATNTSMLPHTALVYNLMVTSGLPRSVLSYIWSAVNRSLPGQLTRPEFFSCLALIALAQKGESLAALSGMSQLPIPYLQACTIPSPSTSSPMASVVRPVVPTLSNPPSGQHFVGRVPPPPKVPQNVPVSSPSKSKLNPVNYIPSSLLMRKEKPASVPPKSSSDILSEIFSAPSNSKSSPSPVVTSPSTSTCDTVLPTGTVQAQSHSHTNGVSSSASQKDNQGVNKKIEPQQVDSWVRCLCAACELLEEADGLWSESTDTQTLREVAETERGRGYLDALYRAVQVVDRISLSASGIIPPDIVKRVQTARGIWKRLSAYGTHLTIEDTVGGMEEIECCCDLCSLSVSHTLSVSYGGRKYHSECANLWVNKVNPLLPNLHLR